MLEGNEGQLKSVLMKCPHALSLSPSVCQPGGRGASQFVVCGLLVFFILPVRTWLDIQLPPDTINLLRDTSLPTVHCHVHGVMSMVSCPWCMVSCVLSCPWCHVHGVMSMVSCPWCHNIFCPCLSHSDFWLFYAGKYSKYQVSTSAFVLLTYFFLVQTSKKLCDHSCCCPARFYCWF